MIPPASIQIRFADLDVLGHVNNAVYFSYMEMARVHYFKLLLGLDWDWKTYGMLIVHNAVDYEKPLFLHQQLQIEMACVTMGNKSFELSYLFKTNEGIHARAKSIQVCFDATIQRTIQLPEEFIAGLNKIQVEND